MYNPHLLEGDWILILMSLSLRHQWQQQNLLYPFHMSKLESDITLLQNHIKIQGTKHYHMGI